MRSYHVITPFSRFSNLTRMIRMLEPMGVVWHPILDEGLPFDIKFPQPWILKGYCPPKEPFWQFWSDCLNRFVAAGDLNPDARYCLLNDDDFYEPDFFEKIDKHDGEVVICSMKRGDHTPAAPGTDHAHGTNTLEAKPESMNVGYVGAEQMIVSGRVFATCHWVEHMAADGINICEVIARNTVDWAPEAFVWFNYLESGRYDSLPI